MTVDIDVFHVWLQRAAGPGRVLTINQRRLCDEFLLDKSTLNRAIKRMVNEGRLIKLAGELHQPARFEVVDAREWRRSAS